MRQLHDGSFEFVGREDDLVKIQGIRIELSEIAYALRSCHPQVEQVDVHFLNRQDRPSKVIVAFLVAPDLVAPDEGVNTDERGVGVAHKALSEAKNQLPEYMIPRVFIVVGSIPRTSSAKVDRIAIKRLYADLNLSRWESRLGATSSRNNTQPGLKPQEIEVVETIAELTGTLTGAMNRQSTLPSIGVDSITATRLIVRLHARGIHVSISDIFQSASLGDLFRHLSNGGTSPKPTASDASAPHNRYQDGLDSSLAAQVERALPALPLQESLISESLRTASAYWSHSLFSLDPLVDLLRLRGCWDQLAQYIDILRVSFFPVAELKNQSPGNVTLVQLIHKKIEVDYRKVRLEKLSTNLQAKEAARKIAEKHQQLGFAHPPWAVTIFEQASCRVMMLSLHHSIRDEASLNSIMKELKHAYLGTAHQLLPQRTHYGEAVDSLYIGDDQSKRNEDFWASVLADYGQTEEPKPWPELKVRDVDSSDEGTITSEMYTLKSYRDLQGALAGIGIGSVTAMMRVIWGSVLLGYLETEKVVFGETWSPRSENPELADVVGPLVSVIPVPFEAKGTVREILSRMMDFRKRSRVHYGVHPRAIRRMLNRPDCEALYPAIFNFVPDHADQQCLDDLQLWKAVDSDIGLSVEHAVALNISLSHDDALLFEITAGKRYMDYEHLDLLAHQVNGLLDIALKRPDEKMSSLLQYMPTKLMSTTPSPAEGLPKNVWAHSPTAWVDHFASVQPDLLAAEVIISIDEASVVSKSWSYVQLYTAYRNVASLINAVGCTKQILAVCLDRSLDVYASILAILSTGNTYLPIAVELPPERRTFLLQDSDAMILFTTSSLASTFTRRPGSCHIILVEEIEYTKPVNFQLRVSAPPTDNAYLLYTSGSTGTPKGVLAGRGNLVSFIEAISQFIGSHVDMLALQGKGKWLGIASYAFDVHLLEMFFPWRHGMATTTAPRVLLLDNLGLALQKLKITHASFVPSLVDNAGLHPHDLPDLRYMSVGGEMITKKLINTWSESQVVLANAYGPTEATIGCCFRRVDRRSNVRNIGFPLAYTTAHVLRFGTVENVLRGTSGELCLTGDLVASGYFNRPNVKGFVENFNGQKMYRTGDRVRMMADGSIEFLGRVDEQTKIRGQRIELGEVSEAVKSAAERLLDIHRAEAATIVAQHPSLARPQLVTFVALQENARDMISSTPKVIRFAEVNTADQIRSQCINTLPSFMIPDHLIRLNFLPLVPTSRKTDSKQLRALFKEINMGNLVSHEYGPNTRAMTEIEDKVRDIVVEVLQITGAKVDVNTNLFRLGLDSLNVISLAVKLQKLGLDSTVSNILRNSSIEHIAGLRGEVKRDNIVTIPPRRNGDLERKLRTKVGDGHDLSNIATVRPCLPLQETLIASSLDHEDRGLYVNHVRLELSPDIDTQRLIEAWKAAAEDFEILRTYFHQLAKHYVQVTLKYSSLSIKNLEPSWSRSAPDLQHWEAKVASEIISQIESKPPIRLMIVSSDSKEQKPVLLVSIHHALYDAESFAMLLDEVYTRYNGNPTVDDRASLSALITHIESQDQRAAKAFWAKYLAGYRSMLFPMQTADHDSGLVARIISSPLSIIDNFAASINCTSASLLQALFGVTLAEILKTNDIVFGAILSGRTVPVEGAHTILAPCITTIPQRMLLDSDSDLKQVISHAQDGFVESIEYQHTALRDIHRWVSADKQLFDTLFSYTRKHEKAQWSHLWQEVESSMPTEFPLAVEIVADRAADQVTARCDFTKAFGEPDKAWSLLDRLEQLLDGLVKGENTTLSGVFGGTSKQDAPEELLDGCWSDEETLIRDIVADIAGLSMEEITKKASFFALGIDSIVAIQLAKRLRQQGANCSSADIMRHSSILQLAQVLVSRRCRDSLTDDPVSSDLDGALANETTAKEPPVYPCTPLQSSMLTQTLGSDGTLYIHHHAICLSLGIQNAQIEQALEELMENTEILRTSFHFSKQAHVWSGKVHRNFHLRIKEYDENTDVAHVLPRIKSRFTFREERDFAEPPWRLDIVRNVYIFSMHHSLYDEESLSLLFRDLASRLKGLDVAARPPFSRAAIALGQQSDEAHRYWARILHGYEGIEITCMSTKFKETTMTLDVDLVRTLQKCKKLGITLQSVALLAYGKMLGQLSGRKDIVFGQLVRGRTVLFDADDVIGPLFNTVPIRINLAGPPTSNKIVLQAIQQQTGEAQSYHHASLSKVQQTWREELGGSDVELFDSLFAFQKRAVSEGSLPWTPVDIEDDRPPTEYAINFEVQQREADIAVCVNSTRIEDLKMFVRAFEQSLRDILDQPENPAAVYLATTHCFENRVSKTAGIQMRRASEDRDADRSDAILRKLRNVLAGISGIPAENIADKSSIFSLGLDSISAIQIAQTGRKEGLSVTVADILQGRTVMGISHRIFQKEKEEGNYKYHQPKGEPTAGPSLISNASRSEVLELVGVRDEDVEAVMPCLPGQSYHLATWLRSGRTLDEAAFIYDCPYSIDLDRLLSAWRKLRVHHPILRTVFTSTRSTSTVQVILKQTAVRSDAFYCLQLTSVDVIAKVVKQLVSRRFDLFIPPCELWLLRWKDRSVIVLRLHHALYDAWTVPALVRDLEAFYRDDNPTITDPEDTSILQSIARSSNASSSHAYWSQHLRDAQPTILHSTDITANRTTFHFHHINIPNLQQLDEQCKSSCISLPTLLILAFARTLARLTSTSSPVFGLFQIGRSSLQSAAALPLLNITPLLTPNVLLLSAKESAEIIQNDLATRVPFEQSYLHDILSQIGHGSTPFYNTFINILWSSPSANSGALDRGDEGLFSSHDFTAEEEEDIAPRDRVSGRTAVDVLDTSFLADGNLFLDMVRDKEGDCVKLVVRCDEGVLGGEEADRFIEDVVENFGRAVAEDCGLGEKEVGED